MARPKKEAPNRSDGRYEVKITIGHNMNGEPIRKSFYSDISKDDAKRQAEAYRINSKASEMAGIGIIDKNITFGEWAIIWLEKYKKGFVRENTYLKTYKNTTENYLIPYFGNASLKSISPVDIQNFFNQYGSYSESAINKMRICLKSIFETAIDNDLCIKSPFHKIYYPEKSKNKIEDIDKRYYTAEQVDIIMEFCDSHRYGIYTRILLELGLRCSELLGLQWGDINFDNRTVFIKRSAVDVNNIPTVTFPKSKNSIRKLPVSTELLSRLEKIKGKPDQFIVTNKKGMLFTPTSYTKNRHNVFFTDLINQHPEIHRLSPHGLRHTCGTLLYNRTKDIYAVSKFLGHASVDITAKLYVHNDVEVLRQHLNIQ